MRAHSTTSLPRLAAAATLVALCAGTAPAYDEESVKDQLQPYFGVWLGMYQVETMDLEYLVARHNGANDPKLDIFNPVLPAGGISLGVAYGRVHVGVNGGYQLRDGDEFSKAKQAEYFVHESFKYELIPIDVSLDLALLPNEYPINMLIGGSVGIGLFRFQNPFLFESRLEDTTTVYYPKENSWETSNFQLATAYVGARINLARRLNLEGQLGYRFLSTDGISTDGPDPMMPGRIEVQDSSTLVTLKPLPVDLSGAYLRVDLRWTFASKADRERDARYEERRKVLERLDARTALKD